MRFSSGSMVARDAAVLRACYKRMDLSCTYPRVLFFMRKMLIKPLFRWQYGTYAPVKNNYNWNNLTNVIWVEQPAGTGFSSKGSTPGATSEEQVAEQFAGFWKNFIETFGLQHKKVYVTGESYAGFYVPCQYIQDADERIFANFTPKTLPTTSSRRTTRLSTMFMVS